ncbi:MAG: hypothetical protein ACI39C_07425 [Dietzia sp.]
MPTTYPPPAPTVQGDNITANRFLNSNKLVARRVKELASERMIALALLTGRETTNSGSANIEIDDELFTDRPVEQVAPGSEYSLTTIGDGTMQVIKTVKWGQDVPITDEAIARRAMSPVERALTKLVNTATTNVDQVALALLASSVTQSHAAAAPWSAGDEADPLRDLLLAKAKIRALNLGYEPNALVVDDLTWAYLASNKAVTNAMARETQSNPIVTGEYAQIAGLMIWPTPNAPGPGAWMVDTTQLGGLLTEDLGGGYVRAGDAVETKSIREDKTDSWLVRARAVCTPYVTAPNAAIRITGVSA